MWYVYSIMLFVSVMAYSADVYAINGRTTYQAKIFKPDGHALEAVSVNFRFTVLDPSSSCILYVEDYAAVNMIGSGGLISFSLGMGTRTYPASGPTTFAGVFDNSISSFVCQTPGVFNPIPTDNRKVVMQFNEGNGWQTLPAMAINSVPYAMYSAKSQNSALLNGKADSDFVETSTLAALNCQTNEAIKFNGATFSCIPVGVSSSGISGVTTSGTVLITGGTVSAPVISITAATLSSDGYLTSLDYAEFKAKLSASSTEIITTLGFAPVSGSAVNAQIQDSQLSGDVSGTIASNSVQSVGGKTAAQVSTSVDETLSASSSAAADTLVKRNASGNFSANEIFASSTNVNYVDIYKPSTSFNIRLQAPTSLAANYTLNLPTSSGTVGQVLSTDGAGNLSWISAATGSVTSVSATAPLFSTGGATPTISIAQSTSSTDGYLSSVDWATFNSKQQATSSAIIATLGYTPAHATSATQWNNNSTSIYYDGGYVGIGKGNPMSPLDVSGTALIGNSTGQVSVGSDGNSYLEFRETDNTGTPYIDFANDTGSDFDFRFILQGNNRFAMHGANIGIRENNPTAFLHLADATSSTSSLKFTSGTLLTSPQSGAMEYDGYNFYLTDGTNTRRTIATGSVEGSIDNASNINSSSNITLTPTGSVVVSSTTASTNSTTGALVVNGGLGVAGNINAGGYVQATSFSATTGMAIGSVSSGSAKLHIGGAANQIDILIQPVPMGSTDTSRIRFADSDGGSTPMDIVYTDIGGAQLAVMGGRFGVGTALPITDFEVSGSMSIKGGEIFLQRPVTNGGWARGLSYTPDGSIDTTTQGIAGIGVYGTSTTTNSIYLTHGPAPWNSTLGMHILPTGKVGIGTFAPLADLHVKSNNVNTQVRIEGSPSGTQAETLYKANGIEWATGVGTGNTGSDNYAIYNNRIGLISTITASGSMGVGTSTPGEKLDVAGNMRVGSGNSSYISFYGTVGDGGGVYNHTYIGERYYSGIEASELFLFKGNDSDNASGPDRIRLAGGNILFDTYASPDAPSGSFEAVATSPMITTKMMIKGNGEVGMGTITPEEELTVSKVQDGDTSINVMNTSSGALARSAVVLTNSGTGYGVHSGGLLLGGKTHGTHADKLFLFANSGITSGVEIATSAASADIVFKTLATQERLRVTTAGNVGVGVETPTSKLHVNGGIKQPNLGQFISHFDGVTRTVSMPAFLTTAYMDSHLDETYTWRAPPPRLKDTAGCNAGTHGNHSFEPLANDWNGVYTMTIGKHGSSALWFADIQWRGWAVNLHDASGVVVNAGSNLGTVQATLTFDGTNWVVEHMLGQVGATPFSCH